MTFNTTMNQRFNEVSRWGKVLLAACITQLLPPFILADNPVGQPLTTNPSLLDTAFSTRPGQETQVGYSGSTLIPEIEEFRTLGPLFQSWLWARTPSSDNRNALIGIAAVRVVPHGLETKSRMDLKPWVQTVLASTPAFQVYGDGLSAEEMWFRQVSSNRVQHSPTRIGIPALTIEAEVTAYDEGINAKNSGVRMDILLTERANKPTSLFQDSKGNPVYLVDSEGNSISDQSTRPSVSSSFDYQRFLNNSAVIVTVRVKDFNTGSYMGSSIVGATLAEKGKSLNLGLQIQGIGPDFFTSSRVAAPLQQAILRCTTRGMMLALSRSIYLPYWKVMPAFPADSVIQNGLKDYLSKIHDSDSKSTQTVAQLPKIHERMKLVLEEPYLTHTSPRPEIDSIMSSLKLGPVTEPSSNPESAPITLEIAGASENQLAMIVASLQNFSRSPVNRNFGWHFQLNPKPQFKDAKKLGAALVKSLNRDTKQIWRVSAVVGTRIHLVTGATF